MKKRGLAIITFITLMVSLLVPIGTAFGADEFIFSDSFEESFTDVPKNWTRSSSGNKIKVETKIVQDGKQSVNIIDESTTLGGGIESSKFPVKPNTKYEFSVDTYVNSGTASVFCKIWDESNKQVVSKSGSSSSTGSWKTVKVILDAPSDAKTASIILCINNAVVGDVLFDNVKIKEFKEEVASGKTEVQYPPTQSEPVNAKLVTPDGATLKYSPYNNEGDMIADFSYAGFYKGEKDLPDVSKLPLGETLSPSSDPNADDTKRIQDAVDKVSSSTEVGKMQVVKLEAGKYNVNKAGITLKNGVVLLGSGQGPTGTVIYATAPVQHTVIKTIGNSPAAVSDKINITDDYVKVGSYEINVEDSSKFNVDDLITIYHPSTDEWAKGLGMSNIVNGSGVNHSWKAGSVDMQTERTIKAIDGSKITLDMPLYVPLNKKYSQSYIYKTDDSKRIQDFGVENLRVESTYNGNKDDENHANIAIGFTNSKNGFVRNVSAKHFILSAVRCGANSKQITVQNCSFITPISQVAGSRRYSFSTATSAQQILFTGCYSMEGRHDYTSSLPSTGPLVYVDNVSDMSTNASETHGTWTTGMLYDNLFQIENNSQGLVGFVNRGIYGSALSQGWSGAGCVAWNTLANTIIGHKPGLTYNNFLIGTWGRFLDPLALAEKADNISSFTPIYRTDTVERGKPEFFKTTNETPFTGDSYREAETTPVEPRSLYKAQLSLRLSGDYRNTRPNAPIIYNPKPELEFKEKEITINGVYQLGAEKVTVYVDDKPLNTTIDAKSNTFTATVSLDEGYHKIYAIQTINGVDSVKNADRFIKVGTNSANKDYLSSNYTRDNLNLLTNDKRETFDQYQANMPVDNSIKVIVNGSKLVSDVAPTKINDRVLVPMRAIFEVLGATVTWNEETLTAEAIRKDKKVKITENQTTAYVNDEPITLDVPATIIDGRFIVPVRFISESFGADVDWIETSQTVMISLIDKEFLVYPPVHDIENALTLYNLSQNAGDGTTEMKNIVDGDIGSYVGIPGDDGSGFGYFELEKETALDKVYIGFHNGNLRKYTFAIEVSLDGKTYTRVIDKKTSSGTTKELENFDLGGVKAKYIKLIGYGNNQNTWNSYNEIVFTEKK